MNKFALLPLLLIFGCDGGSESSPAVEEPVDVDAGVPPAEDEPERPGVEIESPAPVADPVFQDWTCPENWSPIREEDGQPWSFTSCSPPPTVPCEGVEAQLTGSLFCQRIGTSCAERWPSPTVLESLAPGHDQRIYVDASASPGGNGAMNAPYGSIDAALGAVDAPNTVLLLAQGTYAEAVTIRRGVAIVGACTEQTIVEIPAGAGAPQVIRVETDEPVVLGNFTTTGPAAGIAVFGNGNVDVRSMVLRDGVGIGIFAARHQGTLNLDHVLVRNFEVVAASLGGVHLVGAATAKLNAVVIEDVDGVGLFANVMDDLSGMTGPTITATDLAIRRPRKLSTPIPGLPDYGHGMIVGGMVNFYKMERLLIEGHTNSAIVFSTELGESPSIMNLEDGVIRDPDRTTAMFGAGGIFILNAVSFNGTRLRMENLTGAAFEQFATGGAQGGVPSVQLVDVVLGGVEETGTGNELGGSVGGIIIEGGAWMEISRALIRNFKPHGVLLSTSPFNSTSDAVFLPSINENAQPSTVVMEDTILRGGHTAFIEVAGLPPAAQAQIELYLPGVAGFPTGGGLMVSNGDFRLSRVAIFDVPTAGIEVAGSGPVPSVFALEDLTVDGVRAIPFALKPGVDRSALLLDESPARAIAVSGNIPEGSLDRVAIRRVGGIGLFVSGLNISSVPTMPSGYPWVVANDISITETLGDPSGKHAGTVLALTGAQLSLNRAELLQNKMVALLVQGAFEGEEEITPSKISATNIRIVETSKMPCGELPEDDPLSCVGASSASGLAGATDAAGFGAVIADGGDLELESFEIAESSLAGILVTAGSTIKGRVGVLRDNQIGVNILADGFDTDNLSDEVYLYDNDIPFDAQQLPVPAALGALESVGF